MRHYNGNAGHYNGNDGMPELNDVSYALGLRLNKRTPLCPTTTTPSSTSRYHCPNRWRCRGRKKGEPLFLKAAKFPATLQAAVEYRQQPPQDASSTKDKHSSGGVPNHVDKQRIRRPSFFFFARQVTRILVRMIDDKDRDYRCLEGQ